MSDTIKLGSLLRSTVVKELIVGVTGLMLVGFVVMHLAGNTLIFAGPESYNAYAEKLRNMGPLLWVARIGLIAAAATHISTAIMLSIANRKARVTRYAVNTYQGPRTVATRTMLSTGVIIFSFIWLHLYDFAFADKTGAASIVHGMNNGESLGLYGVVWNAFGDPVRCLIYILAVSAVGFHLSHAVASIWVTIGLLRDEDTPRADWVARILGWVVALGFSSIPVYVFLHTYFL